MSSILRALKKLENEPRHLDETQPLDSKFISLADTGTKRRFSSIFMIVLGTGTICGLVILAGWWLFSEKFQPPPAVSPEIARLNSGPGESPAPSQDLNPAPDSAVSEKPGQPSMESLAAQETAEWATEQAPAVSEESPVPIIGQEDASPAEEQTPEETAPAQKTPLLETGEHVTPPAEKPVAAAASRPATPAKTAVVAIATLNDPDMKLQAVTWSRTPQKRIAVINNRILREGDMVSGYLISTINQDDVILSQEETKWKLLFRIN